MPKRKKSPIKQDYLDQALMEALARKQFAQALDCMNQGGALFNAEHFRINLHNIFKGGNPEIDSYLDSAAKGRARVDEPEKPGLTEEQERKAWIDIVLALHKSIPLDSPLPNILGEHVISTFEWDKPDNKECLKNPQESLGIALLIRQAECGLLAELQAKGLAMDKPMAYTQQGKRGKWTGLHAIFQFAQTRALGARMQTFAWLMTLPGAKKCLAARDAQGLTPAHALMQGIIELNFRQGKVGRHDDNLKPAEHFMRLMLAAGLDASARCHGESLLARTIRAMCPQAARLLMEAGEKPGRAEYQAWQETSLALAEYDDPIVPEAHRIMGSMLTQTRLRQALKTKLPARPKKRI